MTCPEVPQTQAYFDREVDALSAARIEQHLETCAECCALLEDLERGRAMIQDELSDVVAPAALHARIRRALDAQSGASEHAGLDRTASRERNAGSDRGARPRATAMWRSRPFWAGAFSGLGTMAAAAALAFVVFSAAPNDALLDSLVSEHVSSLMPGRLYAVESSDHHTVKPWFAGHADVSPAVADFAQQGFKLVGGRADYLADQRAAVVVYQHGRHLINVFSWKERSRGLSRELTRSGYHMACWKADDLQSCAISDVDWSELRALERLIRGLEIS